MIEEILLALAIVVIFRLLTSKSKLEVRRGSLPLLTSKSSDSNKQEGFAGRLWGMHSGLAGHGYGGYWRYGYRPVHSGYWGPGYRGYWGPGYGYLYNPYYNNYVHDNIEEYEVVFDKKGNKRVIRKRFKYY